MDSYLAEGKMGVAPARSSSTLFTAKVRPVYYISNMRSSDIARKRFSHCLIDVDHGEIPPIPTKNAELSFLAPSDCHVTFG